MISFKFWLRKYKTLEAGAQLVGEGADIPCPFLKIEKSVSILQKMVLIVSIVVSNFFHSKCIKSL